MRGRVISRPSTRTRRAACIAGCALAVLAGSVATPSHSAGAGLGASGELRGARAAKVERYVSPKGSDSAPGTLERPWRTLGRAVDALRPGVRVVVRAGTYAERVDLSHGGKGGEPAVLAAYPGERPVLAGRLKVTADHVQIVGLVIDGSGAAAYDAAVYIAGAQSVEVRRCEVRGATGSGVFVGDDGDPSRNVSLVGNWIHDNGEDDFHDHGIYWAQGHRGLIGNNVIERSAGFGIHLYPDSDDVRVLHNTVVGSGRSAVIVAGDDSAASDRNLIANNILAFNGEFGVRSAWDGPTGSGNIVRGNLLFGNARGNRPDGTYADGLAFGPRNQVSDPRFVDREAGNYRLRASSPARDRALRADALPRDRDGRTRPRGAGPDIGAFESLTGN